MQFIHLTTAISHQDQVTGHFFYLATAVDETLVVGALVVRYQRLIGDQTIFLGQLHVVLVGLAGGLGPLVGEDAVYIKRAADVLVDLDEIAVCVDAVEAVEVALELGGVEGVGQFFGCEHVDLDVNHTVVLQVKLVDLLSDVTDLFA